MPMNRLAQATSPYLLQHAHNPVDWFPWGEEALEKARREERPIFLSIGYSACHWCHVMERESFEDEEIARILNEHFVPIKVDREERPDLDAIYMMATMLYNRGGGGWPMTVMLAPDQKPFFAGTYFPPVSRQGMPGLKDILRQVAGLWREDRGRVTRSAEALAEAVRRAGEPAAGRGELDRELVSRAADELAAAFDPRAGGLISGRTNKFPPSMAMGLMLREYRRTCRAGRPNRFLLDRVETTLEHMANGGIYDHLAGGIARYSTDPAWRVPHFEKMLYDQALVSGIYLDGAQLTGKARYGEVAADVFNYVLADLRSSEGGFCSARDADSEGEEGKYYVWTKDEVMSVLGPRAGELFCSFYDVTDAGNWEGRNVLNVQRDAEVVARLQGIEVGELRRILADARARMLSVRQRRVPPGLDDKVLGSWNGLMIGSLARGGRILAETEYVRAAERAAGFILTGMSDAGRLLRTYRAGRAHTGGYLDDYAFFVEGLLELYRTTLEGRWLNEAVRLNDDMVRLFWDEAGGAFFFTAADAEELIVRGKDLRDGAIPSGNSVAVMNLLRLGLMLGRDDLRDKAVRAMETLAGDMDQAPFGFERLLAAVDFHQAVPNEIVIVGPLGAADTQALIRVVHQLDEPDAVVLLLDPAASGEDSWRQEIPLLRGKGLVRGGPAAYVCRGGTCGRPVTTPEDLRRELES